MAELLATFRGPVSCTRAAQVPGLTLQGDTAEAPGEYTTLGFSAAAPADLPAALPDAVVEHLGGVHYRIRTAGRSGSSKRPRCTCIARSPQPSTAPSRRARCHG